MIGVYFAVLFMTSSSDPRADNVARSFLDSRLKCESLEPLLEFVAFLVQTLCQKIPNISGFA